MISELHFFVRVKEFTKVICINLKSIDIFYKAI